MDIPTDLLVQFCRLTNANEALASQLLRDSGLDLQAAIQSFFAIQDAGGLPEDDSPPPHAAEPSPVEVAQPDDDVPIAIPSTPPATLPRVTEPPSLPNRSFGNDSPNDAPPPRRPSPPTVFPPDRPVADPFQDDADAGDHGEALAALYRPPTHLIHPGRFEDAMTTGRAQQRWVLINVQRSDVFASHIMNRDVWSDSAVRQILQAHFVFWQRDEQRARDYTRFYAYNAAPHVAIIDPRSGERARVWGDNGEPVTKIALLDALQDFVSGNSLDSDAVIRGRAGRSASAGRNASDNAHRQANAIPPTNVADRLQASSSGSMEVDATQSPDDLLMPSDPAAEDAQLAAAIAASMEEVPATENGNASGAPDAASLQREASRLLSATDPTLNQSRNIRAEQDDAFLESLALDRAKEESEKMEKLRKEREERDELAREHEAAELREAKRRRVPEAPASDSKSKITELAIRLPDGKRLQRRFYANNNIGNVYDYIETEVEQLSSVDFELMSPYPRKSFVDREALLEDLAPKAALVVHLKN